MIFRKKNPGCSPIGADCVKRVLDELAYHARFADRSARNAFLKSKHSTQDYWICLEFWTIRLHNRIAKEFGFDRIEKFSFAATLAKLKKEIRNRRCNDFEAKEK